MKKSLLFVLLIITIMPFALASVIEVEKIDKGSVVISELDNPALFDLKITNNGDQDNFEIYSLLSISITPKGKTTLPHGTTTVLTGFYPNENTRKDITGFYTFEYQIKGDNSGIFNDTITIKIVPLSEAIVIGPAKLLPGENKVIVPIQNTQNTNINDLQLQLSSTFFASTARLSLKPYETANLSLDIDNAKTQKLLAGPYVINGKAELEGKEAKISGILNYLEKEGISVNKTSSGYVITKTTITKTNEGNTAVTAKIELSKDVISRLFTIYSSTPMTAERGIFNVKYTWQKQLQPGESMTITSTTNYTMPLIILILVVVIVLLVKIYTRTALVVNKQVSYVRTKGGEFALRVKLHVKAKKHVSKIQIIDRLPGMTKLYEKFGHAPDRIEHSTRRLFWDIPSLSPGEERVFSYIIYSKVAVVGRFELPSATAIFEREGKTHEVLSNKTYFLADMITSKDFA
jgi:hypothetical protein